MKSSKRKTGGRTVAKRFDSLEQEVFLNLWRTYDRLKLLEAELFAQFGLTAQQYNVLRLLQQVHPEPLPTLKIAKRLISSAPDITRMLDQLQANRLIERIRPADNRRTVHVNLASGGLVLLHQLETPVRDCHVRQLGHLKTSEMRQLRDLLKQARLPHESAESVWQ